MKAEATLNIYFAGQPDSVNALTGNAALAEAITEISDHRYCCVLPQNFPQRHKSPERAWEDRVANLIECDLVLFTSGHFASDFEDAAEFLIAKFADMPVVVLQTESGAEEVPSDSNKGILSWLPRTTIETVDSTAIYQNLFAEFPMTDAVDVLIEQRSSEVGRTLNRVVAQAVVDAADRAREQTGGLNASAAPAVYQWLASFLSAEQGSERLERIFMQALSRKRSLDLAEKPPQESWQRDLPNAQ